MAHRFRLVSVLAVWVLVETLLVAKVMGGLVQSADLVLGGSLPNVAGVFVDPVTRTLFVCDTQQSRVLRYPTVDSLNSSSTPVAVIGQASVRSGTEPNRGGPPSSHTLNFPGGIWVDSQGTLWIADTNNYRVMWYNNAGNLPVDPAASGVLGQINFTSSTLLGPSQGSFVNPLAVCVVSNTLWVADGNGYRVLRFDNAGSLTNGALATAVVGSPDFTFSQPRANEPYGMGLAASVLFIPNVGLFVGDCFYVRTVFYPLAEALKPANGSGLFMYGRYNYTFESLPPAEYVTDCPRGLTAASDGTLFMALDKGNKVFVYPPVPPTANLIKAVAVFGQSSLSGSRGGSNLDELTGPWGAMYDEPTNSLWVADLGNNRILRYSNVLVKPVNNPTLDVQLDFDVRSPNFRLAPSDNSTAGSNARFNTAFGSLTEFASNGSEIVSSPFVADGYAITSAIDAANNLQFTFQTNQPAELSIDYTLFATNASLSSAGVNFTTTPGTLKMAISVKNWLFNSSSSLLELSLSLTVSPPVTSMTTTDTPGYTTYTLYSSNILITTIRLLKFCVIDNTTNTPINFTFSQTGNTANATAYTLTIRFPFFSSNVFYDPDFSVALVGSNGGDGGGDGGDDVQLAYLALIALVVIPGVMLAVVAAVVVWWSVKKYRAKLGSEESMSNINF